MTTSGNKTVSIDNGDFKMNELYHFNKNHDKLGRFTFSRGISLKSRTKRKTETNDKSESKGLTDKQKKALKIGAIAAVGALAVVGGIYLYKTGALDKIVSSGKSAADKAVEKTSSSLVGDMEKFSSDAMSNIVPRKLAPDKVPKDLIDAFGDLSNDNPLRKQDGVENNCTNVFLAAVGRMRGFDVAPGYQKNESGEFVGAHAEDIFKCFQGDAYDSMGNSVLKTSKGKNFDTLEKAFSVLKRRYPQDGAYGYIDGKIRQRGDATFSHAFMWQIKDGKLIVGDGVNGLNANRYFSMLDPDSDVHFFRADDRDINWEEFSKRVFNI